jgi:hypothetical protein
MMIGGAASFNPEKLSFCFRSESGVGDGILLQSVFLLLFNTDVDCRYLMRRCSFLGNGPYHQRMYRSGAERYICYIHTYFPLFSVRASSLMSIGRVLTTQEASTFVVVLMSATNRWWGFEWPSCFGPAIAVVCSKLLSCDLAEMITDVQVSKVQRLTFHIDHQVNPIRFPRI